MHRKAVDATLRSALATSRHGQPMESPQEVEDSSATPVPEDIPMHARSGPGEVAKWDDRDKVAVPEAMAGGARRMVDRDVSQIRAIVQSTLVDDTLVDLTRWFFDDLDGARSHIEAVALADAWLEQVQSVTSADPLTAGQACIALLAMHARFRRSPADATHGVTP